MPHYFHGWKRKVGMLTLALACVFVAGWVRSYGGGETYLPYDKDTLKIGYTSVSGHRTYFSRRLVAIPKGTPSDWCEQIVWSIEYRLVTIPLTLLAAGLLFSKPRVTKR